MKIAVIGTGYVGLVSGTCFAALGHDVTCVDKDKGKIDRLRQGVIPIFEQGLPELVEAHTASGKLRFTTRLKDALTGAEAIFIAVGTPEDGEGNADVSAVYAVACELAPMLENGALVVTKSTVPVGTGARVRSTIAELNPELSFEVASNPEFLREGCAVEDFMNPDRILAGVSSKDAEEKLRKLYAPLLQKGIELIVTDIPTAELTKYAANAFLATKIAFINEIADICEHVGADVELLARGIGSDHRIGHAYLSPGPGYGGSCFPKDTLALRASARSMKINQHVLNAVIESNDTRKREVAQKIIQACGGNVSGKVITLLGLAFKANTDDVRHSVALVVAPILQQAGATVRLHDPKAAENAREVLGDKYTWCAELDEAVHGADAVVVLTEWGKEYRELEAKQLKEKMRGSLLLDFRNIYKMSEVASAGLNYYSVGRKPTH